MDVKGAKWLPGWEGAAAFLKTGASRGRCPQGAWEQMVGWVGQTLPATGPSGQGGGPRPRSLWSQLPGVAKWTEALLSGELKQ